MTEPLSHLPPARRAAVDALTNERGGWVIHKFANFLVSTDLPACGMPKPQIRALETQAVHNRPTGFPQGAVRFCEQRGGP